MVLLKIHRWHESLALFVAPGVRDTVFVPVPVSAGAIVVWHLGEQNLLASKVLPHPFSLTLAEI